MTRIRSGNSHDLRCSSPAHYSNWRNWRTGANRKRGAFCHSVGSRDGAMKPSGVSEPEVALKTLGRRLYGLCAGLRQFAQVCASRTSTTGAACCLAPEAQQSRGGCCSIWPSKGGRPKAERGDCWKVGGEPQAAFATPLRASSVRLTCMGLQVPSPRGVGMPASFRPSAMAASVEAPCCWI